MGNRLKKFTAIILTIVLAFGGFSTIGSAEAATVTVGSTGGAKGQTVYVPVTIEGNPGLADVSIKFEYDATQMTLTAFSGAGGMSVDSVSQPSLGTVLLTDPSEEGYTGSLLVTLTFEISSTATEGLKEVSISSSVTGFGDKDTNIIYPTFVAGNINVFAKAAAPTASTDFRAIENGAKPSSSVICSFLLSLISSMSFLFASDSLL